MKSNKYKFRMSGYPNGVRSIAIYNQRASQPLIIIGEIDVDNLFTPVDVRTPSYSARHYIGDNCKYKGKVEVDHISGSIRFDEPAMLALLPKISRISFRFRSRGSWPAELRIDGGEMFEIILLIEYIKKHGKFYGKKERLLERGKESSQDQLQEGADLA